MIWPVSLGLTPYTVCRVGQAFRLDPVLRPLFTAQGVSLRHVLQAMVMPDQPCMLALGLIQIRQCQGQYAGLVQQSITCSALPMLAVCSTYSNGSSLHAIYTGLASGLVLSVVHRLDLASWTVYTVHLSSTGHVLPVAPCHTSPAHWLQHTKTA